MFTLELFSVTMTLVEVNICSKNQIMKYINVHFHQQIGGNEYTFSLIQLLLLHTPYNSSNTLSDIATISF